MFDLHTCLKCSFEGTKKSRKGHKCLTDEILGREQYGGGETMNIHPFNFKSSFNGEQREYNSKNGNYVSVQAYFSENENSIKNFLVNSLKELNSIKIVTNLNVEYIRKRNYKNQDVHTEELETEIYNAIVLGDLKIITHPRKITSCLEDIKNSLASKVEIFEKYGSGWILNKVIGADFLISRITHQPIGTYIETPPCIVKKRATVNLKSNTNECFKYAILSSLFRQKCNASKVSTYRKYEHFFNFDSVPYPVTIPSIRQFEKVNTGIAVNIFSYKWNDDKIQLIPEYISKHIYKRKKTANLLLLEEKNVHHFIGITNINRLLGKKNCHSKFLCYNCLNYSKSQKRLERHIPNCLQNVSQKIEMPEERLPGQKPVLKFRNFRNQLKAAFVAYCDFESILKPRNKKPLSKKYRIDYDGYQSNTRNIILQEHIPASFSVIIVDHEGNLYKKFTYQGEDCVDRFMDMMQEETKRIIQKLKTEKLPMNLTEKDEHAFQIATTCHICKNKLYFDKVRDHCHLTGKFRGASHNSCNLQFQQRETLPIFFHNFQNYDSFLLLKAFEKYGKNVQIIPNNSKKYLGIKVDNMLFLDSFQFLASSLDSLVNIIKTDEKNFKLMRQVFGENYHALLRKGVFCYDYIDEFSKFNDSNLPSKKYFYNNLTEEHISDSDYSYAKQIFKLFNLKSLGQYCEIYVESDCCLLACIFEAFRNTSLNYYELDPVYYFSLPGLAWDSVLRYSKVKLSLLTDLDEYMFFERAIRGGQSIIMKRYAKAENQFLQKEKVDNLENSFILYLDRTSLYSETMMAPLPVSHFRFLTKTEITNFDLNNYQEDSEYGAFLEVDLSYKNNHDEHNDYPLAPESITVPYDYLSKYQRKLLKKHNMKYNEKQSKLIGHFFDRNKYVLHSRNLQYYISNGMSLKHIHRIMVFKQKAWMKDFIEFNISKRAVCETDFEKDFFKLINNACFGRSCMNKRKRIAVKVVNNKLAARRYVAKPTYKYFHRITDNLLLFIMNQPVVMLDAPIYTGAAILDLSKEIMYRFHYDEIRKNFPNSECLFTDTDSLCYLIKTQNVYKDLYKIRHKFDFSEYPTSGDKDICRLHSKKNRKKIGTMKDEACGSIIEEFVGLAPKCYSLKIGNKNKNTAKGVKKIIKKRMLSHDVYRNVLKTHSRLFSSSKSIRSRMNATENLGLYTIYETKSSLSCFDSKRFIRSDGINTYAHGHYKIKYD